jgi:hypothetical protein
MHIDEIKPGRMYLLADGRIVRVVSIHAGSARCDLFDPKSIAWVFLDHALPAWIFKETCVDPFAE